MEGLEDCDARTGGDGCRITPLYLPLAPNASLFFSSSPLPPTPSHTTAPLTTASGATPTTSAPPRGAMELSKEKGKAICVSKGKKSMLDGDLEKTVR
ncbi:hypothetical protein RHMOL_Rhmol04G0265200 [Rhododendron molle]|uniref:Uncharacterized protein n=1 Tax=Rhododendron molle TaxID=49168 RepID=A0ACC0P725_RHOML|nr:hypothetical protein RHMOL_Rhmol04G0265200 [Rhododendron molle]